MLTTPSRPAGVSTTVTPAPGIAGQEVEGPDDAGLLVQIR